MTLHLAAVPVYRAHAQPPHHQTWGIQGLARAGTQLSCL